MSTLSACPFYTDPLPWLSGAKPYPCHSVSPWSDLAILHIGRCYIAPGPVRAMALSFLTSAVPPTQKNCASIDVRGPEGDNGKTDVFCSDIVKYRRYSIQRKNIYVSIQLVYLLCTLDIMYLFVSRDRNCCCVYLYTHTSYLYRMPLAQVATLALSSVCEARALFALRIHVCMDL